MTSNIKKILASLLALAALALGGAAIANATSGGGGHESANEKEAPDPGEAVSPAVAAKAKAAAEAKTGATAQSVNAETPDSAEQADGQDASEPGEASDQGETPDKAEAHDAADQPTPAGTAYEVDLTKGSKEFKVSLDKQFKVLQVETEQAD